MMISMIVALATNRVIGRDNDLPWHLPDDLRFFKRMTLGKPIIMGRKTFESIGRPLPKRHNIILTRNTDFTVDGCTVVHTADEALAAAGDVAEVVIIGGAAIYELFLPHITKLYLTVVQAEPEGDTLFPAIDLDAWIPVDWEHHAADEHHAHAFEWQIWER